MKIFRLIVFTILIVNFSINAQNCDCKFKNNSESKISLLGGLSIVDDGFTEDYNLFKAQDRWHYGFFIGVEYLLAENFSLQLAYSAKVYKEGKSIDGGNILQEDINYSSLNLHALYSFKNLLQVSPLDPYLISGLGLTSIDQEQRPTLNLGAGIRIWFGDIFYTRRGFHKDLAFDIKTLGLFNLPVNQYGRQLQHTAGLLYRF